MEKKNPMERDGMKEITMIKPNKYKVIDNQGNKFIVDGDNCGCGHERNYTPGMSTSFEQSYDERRKHSCEHQVAVLNSENIGPCSECGEYILSRQKMHHHGRHVMNNYTCISCGNTVHK